MSSENSSGHDGSHNSSGKLMKLAYALIIVSILGTLFWFRPQWYQNYAPKQPVPFSHKRHAGQFNIPCLYCHGAAEYTEHAEVPGLETCMNCHSVVLPESPYIKQVKAAYEAGKPLEWVKVHVLPDFVYFNHKRHIAAGLACQTCHGPVQEMDRIYQWAPLTMAWCVNCHRNDDHVTEFRKNWSKSRKEMKGEGDPSLINQLLSHPDPHNAEVSCSTCHR